MRIVAALGDNSWLFTLTGDVLVPVVDLRIPAVDDWIRVDGGVAAVIHGEPSVFLIEHEGDQVEVDILRLPRGADPRSIAAWNDWIFVAGRGGDAPMLAMGRWRDEVSVWRSIYPERFKQFGRRKKIGALFTCGDRLIAVDNIVTPKFLALFSVTAEGVGEPELLELQGHGPYETIHSAALTPGRLALLSGTGSMTGPGFFISIVDPMTAEEVVIEFGRLVRVVPIADLERLTP